MKAIQSYLIALCLTVTTLMLCGCSQIFDLAVGDWYGTEEIYILDSEDDPVRFAVNMHLVLGGNWKYTMEFTFNGTEQVELQDYHDLSYSGEWSRQKQHFEFTNFGQADMTHFTDKEITLECKWPFNGRNVSELSLSPEDRQALKNKKTTITLYKRQ